MRKTGWPADAGNGSFYTAAGREGAELEWRKLEWQKNQ